MKIKQRSREEFHFYLFILPWILGFLAFTAYPVISSLYYSFTQYDAITPAKFIGLENYKTLFHEDVFYKSIKATLLYTAIGVPLGMVVSLGFAMLLNCIRVFQNFFRTALYFPSMISGVTMSLTWLWLFNPRVGLVNFFLSLFGIHGPAWLLDYRAALFAVIIMSLWGVGGGMVIFLASLKSVPETYYEAAILDGAGPVRRFLNITLPMISPVILFQLMMTMIDAFQIFTPAYVMTQGGPQYATWFYVFYLYKSAFSDWKVGYSSALGWILLAVVTIVSFIIIKTSDKFVYYEGGKN